MSDLHHDAAYQEMARLVNFDQSNTVAPDNIEAGVDHPEDHLSPRRFSQMGSTKLLFVAGGVSVVALLVGLITNQIFRPVSITTTDATEPSYEAGERLTLSLEPPIENNGELGALRTEVALKDQAQELQDIDGNRLTEPNTPAISGKTESNQTAAAPQPSAAPVATSPTAQPAFTSKTS